MQAAARAIKLHSATHVFFQRGQGFCHASAAAGCELNQFVIIGAAAPLHHIQYLAQRHARAIAPARRQRRRQTGLTAQDKPIIQYFEMIGGQSAAGRGNINNGFRRT